MNTLVFARCSPARAVLLSVAITIIIGVALLALPVSRVSPVPFADLIFTAVSATCVCGLFTIDLNVFSLMGKAIILLLMQIGGLGLITMSLFFVSLFIDLGLATQVMAGHILDLDTRKNVKELLFFITMVTVTVECIGALAIAVTIAADYTALETLVYSFFHSISSFCNAGISVFPTRLEVHTDNIAFIGVTTILMFVGGLGFVTIHDIGQFLYCKYKKRWYRMPLQSALVLYGSFIITGATGVLFWLIERDALFSNMSIMRMIVHVLFYAVSFRSTGFLLDSLYKMHQATWMLIMMVAFIGSAPGSTGSGVKLTTVIIMLMIVRAVMSKRNVVEIKGRCLGIDQVFKAVAIITLSVLWILAATFCLLLTEQGWQFFDILFEVSSAVSSLGISTGITPHLSTVGKIIIAVSMLIGRVGTVSFILALRMRKTMENDAFSYPEERVMLG